MDLVAIIKDYQNTIEGVVAAFQKKYNVIDLLDGWHAGVYPQIGAIKESGIKSYAFHGIGLEVELKDKFIDFDFAFFPAPKYGGFDLWRLTGFIESQPKKFSQYLDNAKLENDFEELCTKGVIRSPFLPFTTSLYFFSDDLQKKCL